MGVRAAQSALASLSSVDSANLPSSPLALSSESFASKETSRDVNDLPVAQELFVHWPLLTGGLPHSTTRGRGERPIKPCSGVPEQ